MAIPEFLTLPTEADYKQYFIDNYCTPSPIATWDGLPVVFYPEMFEHAFYKRASEHWRASKSVIDLDRCKRMSWIKDVLADSTIVPMQGYDHATGKYDNNSRVALVSKERYVVVIRYTGTNWRFVTAYYADSDRTYTRLLGSPAWVRPTSTTT